MQNTQSEPNNLAERNDGFLPAPLFALRLQEATAAFSKSVTPEEVADTALAHMMKAPGCYAGIVALSDEQGSCIRAISLSGYPPAVMSELGRISFGVRLPVVDAARSGQAIFLPTLEAFRRAYPDCGAAGATSPTRAVAAVPLTIEDRVIGSVAVSFSAPQEFAPVTRAFLFTLASQAAQALERARLYQEAREAIQVRDDFLSIASHELRAPLTTLGLQLDLIRQGLRKMPGAKQASERLAYRLGSAERQVQRLSRIVGTLVDVTRIRHGRFPLSPERLDLREVIREVADLLEEQLSRTGCELTLDAPEPVEGTWDPLRIEQVIVNLVSNAIKYGEGKPVTVTLRRESGMARLAVRDQGPGIPTGDQSRIFERFERATSKEVGGMGLGLYIAKGFVEAHDGRISLRSEPGSGTTFEVELPLEPAD